MRRGCTAEGREESGEQQGGAAGRGPQVGAKAAGRLKFLAKTSSVGVETAEFC